MTLVKISFECIIQSWKDIHTEPLVVTSACGALDPLKDDSTGLANLLEEQVSSII
jgi:hypothetical protein